MPCLEIKLWPSKPQKWRSASLLPPQLSYSVSNVAYIQITFHHQKSCRLNLPSYSWETGGWGVRGRDQWMKDMCIFLSVWETGREEEQKRDWKPEWHISCWGQVVMTIFACASLLKHKNTGYHLPYQCCLLRQAKILLPYYYNNTTTLLAWESWIGDSRYWIWEPLNCEGNMAKYEVLLNAQFLQTRFNTVNSVWVFWVLGKHFQIERKNVKFSISIYQFFST